MLGAEGTVILAGRGAAEPPQVRHHVEIVRVGKRDIVVADERGAEHRFRVTDVDGVGFRSAARRDLWSRAELLVPRTSPVVTLAQNHAKAAHIYFELTKGLDRLRDDRTSEVAAEVRDTAQALVYALLDLEEDAKETP
ncbi:hypothetical protein AXK58_25415 [Tsukamurella tyrosinosolvens]|nr:hypothetical protein AXK58_25415 [Tsukamurella tyrosinosolvens]